MNPGHFPPLCHAQTARHDERQWKERSRGGAVEGRRASEAVEEPKKKKREKVMKGDSQTKAPPPDSILLNSHPSAVITLKGPGRRRPFLTQGTGLGSVT